MPSGCVGYFIAPSEKRIIIEKAMSRQSNLAKAGWPGHKRGAWDNCEHPNLRSHVIGMLGEYATAMFLGIDVAEVKHDTQGLSDGGVDLVAGGWKLTIKTRHQMNMPDVLWHAWATDTDVSQDVARADVLIGCSLTCKRGGICYCSNLLDDDRWALVLLHGYIPTVCIRKPRTKKRDLGNGLRWLFPKKDLLPMRSLTVELYRTQEKGGT